MKRILLLCLLVVCGCRRHAPAPIPEHNYGAVAVGSTPNAPLAATGSTPANGLAAKTSPCTIRSAYINNNTGSNAWAVISDSTAIPTGFTTMVGIPVLLPANSGVILGTDFFGTGGWTTATGCSVGISTVGSSGSFTAAGASFDILVNGT